MTQKILAIATALLAAPALLSSAANACISCSYVPEVVKGSQTNEARPEAKPYVRERAKAVEREPSPRAAKRSVRSEPDRKKVDTAETTPAAKESSSDNQNSSIAAMAAAFDAPTATARAQTTAHSENSSIARASTDVGATAIAQAESKPGRSESSSIAVAFRAPAATETAQAEAKPDRGENSSISVASTEVVATEKAPIAEAAKPVVAKAADCKKFVPSVGMIVSVSCE